MKKTIKLFLIITILILPTNVFSRGSITVSPSNITVEVGTSKIITIAYFNTIGEAQISSKNPSIATISKTDSNSGIVDAEDTKNDSVYVTGKSVGTTSINFICTGATFDEESINNQVRTVNVTVVPKSNTKTYIPSSSNNNTSNLSNNCELQNLSVEGHKIEKKDVNNYKLTVSYGIESINIKATAKDKKTTITGTGTKKLNIGENNFEVILTAESGKKNIINLKVTRKEGYYLNDIDSALEDITKSSINIIINSEDKVSTSLFNKIVKTKKEVNLNYYDSNKKNVYSWLISGKEAKDNSFLNTNLTEIKDQNNKMLKLSNYADGIFLRTKQSYDIPLGTKIKYYVGNKYDNNDKVNIYCYTKGMLQLVKRNAKVENGYITFEAVNTSDYLLTKSIINTMKNVEVPKKSSINSIFLILIIFVVFLSGTIIVLLKNQKQVKKI